MSTATTADEIAASLTGKSNERAYTVPPLTWGKLKRGRKVKVMYNGGAWFTGLIVSLETSERHGRLFTIDFEDGETTVIDSASRQEMKECSLVLEAEERSQVLRALEAVLDLVLPSLFVKDDGIQEIKAQIASSFADAKLVPPGEQSEREVLDSQLARIRAILDQAHRIQMEVWEKFLEQVSARLPEAFKDADRGKKRRSSEQEPDRASSAILKKQKQAGSTTLPGQDTSPNTTQESQVQDQFFIPAPPRSSDSAQVRGAVSLEGVGRSSSKEHVSFAANVRLQPPAKSFGSKKTLVPQTKHSIVRRTTSSSREKPTPVVGFPPKATAVTATPRHIPTPLLLRPWVGAALVGVALLSLGHLNKSSAAYVVDLMWVLLSTFAVVFAAHVWNPAVDVLQPEEVLQIGRPASFLPPKMEGRIPLAGGEYAHTGQLAVQVCKTIERQLASGSQVGMQACVYLKGKEVLNVCGGVRRVLRGSGDGWGEGLMWEAVRPDTLFMGYSVCKGVAATALMTVVDSGHCTYDTPVASLWPELTCGLSPRSPTGDAEAGRVLKTAGKGSKSRDSADERLTVGELVSHRGGVPGLGLGCVLAGLLANFCGWRFAWRHGERFVERCTPAWPPGDQAEYHAVSFSWLVGGVVERACGSSIWEVVRERVAPSLRCGGDLHLGMLPPVDHQRVAALEAPLAYRHGMHGDSVRGWLARGLAMAVAAVELRVFTWVGNTDTWKRKCLPSSNGFQTARALARMYGALANGGRLADGSSLVSDRTVALASEAVADVSSAVPTRQTFGFPEQQRSMLGLGFTPWPNPLLHGDREGATFAHEGMGGCAAFAQPGDGFAIAVLKNAYEPFSWAAGTVTPDVKEIVDVVKAQLKLL